jgi:transcriptional regulator with XRE-family HTH domain/quercetin dioxygenase-like cupin family protein
MTEPPPVIDDRRARQRLIYSGIGARVSEVRRRTGLRVADLAAAVGVSPSLISQIERGRSAPSVATLFMLAKALAVPVDDLFEEMRPGPSSSVSVTPADPFENVGRTPPQSSPDSTDAAAHRYMVRRSDRAILDIRGGVRWERLTPMTSGDAEFLELVYSPGAVSDTQLYRHPGWEMVVVLCGRLDIYVGFERHELGVGDSMSFPSSMPHRYVNPSEETARAITVILRDAVFVDDKGTTSSDG